MQIPYRITSEDYRESILYRLRREGKKSFQVVRWFVLAYAIGIVFVCLMFSGGPFSARLAAAAGNPAMWVFLLAFFFTDYHVMARLSCWISKKRGGVHERNFTPKRLLLLPECLKVIEEDTGAEEAFPYSHFTELCTTRTLILLMMSKSLMIIIPRRCFESEGQAALFLDTIRQAQKACEAPPPSLDKEEGASTEGKEGGLRISYDFDDSQFLSLQYEQTHFIHRTMWKRAGFWIECAFILLSIFMLAGSFKAVSQMWLFPVIYSACLFVFVYFFLILYGRPKWLVRRMAKTAKEQGRVPPGTLGPHTLVIGRDGIHNQSGAANMFTDWGQADALYQGQAFWLLLRKQYTIAVIPLGCIEDPQALLETIRRYAPAIKIIG